MRVRLNGMELTVFITLPMEELRRNVAVLFRTAGTIPMRLRRAHCLGDIRAMLESSAGPHGRAAAGAEDIIARLPQGYQHLLGNWFENGTELSVGEWQRISLARAFLRDAAVYPGRAHQRHGPPGRRRTG